MQLKKFSDAAQKVLIQCRLVAKKNQNLVEPEHLALALIETEELRELLNKKSVEHKALHAALLKLISNLPFNGNVEPNFSARMISALSSAEALSISKQHDSIFVSDLFLSLVENRNKYGALGAVLSEYFLSEEITHKRNKSEPPIEGSSSQLLSVSDNLNLLIKNDEIDPVFGREKEIERIIQVLSRKSQNNPLLIGEPGVGRTSIVYGLVKRIIDQNIPSHLISKEILALDVSALVAGTTLRGQFEERMRKLLGELVAKKGQYILFVRDMSMLSGAGGDGASDAANLLKPSLSRGLIQLIGLVTPDGYKKRIETDPSFERYFQPIWIMPPTNEECTEMLMGLKERYERFHGVFIEDDAIRAAIDLGARHLTGRILPELALDILDEACSRHRIMIDRKPAAIVDLNERINAIEAKKPKKSSEGDRSQNVTLKKLQSQLKKKTEDYEREMAMIETMRALKNEIYLLLTKTSRHKDVANGNGRTVADLSTELTRREIEFNRLKKSERLIDPFVKRDDIAMIISQETGIPVKKMMQSEREKLGQMEAHLAANVIGQTEAIKAVANAIRRARVGLKDLKRPIGSFLFLGPTGVGKTELARCLTNFLFDDERAMVRFDMSEFMERHSVARLIGAPPGYQGSDEGGQLTEKVRRKPYSVVLFDEIEKAHQDILNVLLQVLDEGRLTDSLGHLVHFSNTVIIMTSNVGADILLEDNLVVDKAKKRELIMERLFNYLRPELINRIDEIVIFNAIDKAGIVGIADLMLASLTKRLQHEGFELTIANDVKDLVIKEGYSREFGARPLKRAIQRLMENPLAMKLVKDGFHKGDRIEAVLSNNGEIDFRKG